MTRESLRALFNVGELRSIGPCRFMVSKLGYEDFDDALIVGPWVQSLDEAAFFDQLRLLKPGAEVIEALHRTLARALALLDGEPDTQSRQLTVKDVLDMPLVMQAEALAVVMEVNADFFFQALKRLQEVAHRIGWTGLALLSSSSAQGISPRPSGDTPSANSADS